MNNVSSVAGSEPALSNPSHSNLPLLLTGHPKASHNIQSISEHPWSILRLLPSCFLRLGLTVPSRNPNIDALAPSLRAAPISPYCQEVSFSMQRFFGIAKRTCDSLCLYVFWGVTFGHHFGAFCSVLQPSKKRPCRLGRANFGDFINKKNAFFCFHF